MFSVILIPLCLLVVIINYVFNYYQRSKLISKYKCKPITQLPTKTILGKLGIDALFNQEKTKKSGTFHEDLYSTFKSLKTTTFQNTLLFQNQVMTIEPENIRLCTSSAHFNDWNIGWRSLAFEPLLGNGIFSSESGPKWKHSRMMLRPIFAKEHLKQITEMEQYTQSIIKIIKLKNGVSFDLQQLFNNFTIDYATNFLFGESCDSLKDLLGEISTSTIDKDLKNSFAEAFNVSQDYLTKRASLGPFMFLCNDSKFKEANKIQHEFVSYYVNKAINLSEKELIDDSKSYTFLYQLAKQTNDPQVLQDELLNILLAGRNTTASLLSFLFFELAHNPKIFQKLKSEILKYYPDVNSITFESLQSCQYLKFVINETLRYNPSVPISTRTASKLTILPKGGGSDNESPILIEKGTRIVFPLFVSNRNEKYFGERTNEFIPERWENLPANGGIAFMPFSTGPRLCLGQQFALIETSYLTIRFLQEFNQLEIVDDVYPPLKTANASMRLLDGCNVIFT
ncbi:unnamed protein product [Candida verbasci]|uniref:Cytochrome P450 n=1 Tax=Candida verbasci TaxID=1227364 RepID=A0A9W4XC95_9ASCO|nr:unnamed protein product [Candida verbasci]